MTEQATPSMEPSLGWGDCVIANRRWTHLYTRQYMNELREWSYANNMQINKQKTKEMIITTSRTASLPLYPNIQRVETLKLLGISGARSTSKVGAQKLFYCAPTFSSCPMTGQYRKVQGTVTRTELGQKWPTIRGQSDLRLFKVTLVTLKVISPEDRALLELGWFPMGHLLTPTPHHAAFPRYCTSILKHIIGQFKGTSTQTLAAGSRAPEGIWSIGPRLTHDYCCRGCVPEISSISILLSFDV